MLGTQKPWIRTELPVCNFTSPGALPPARNSATECRGTHGAWRCPWGQELPQTPPLPVNMYSESLTARVAVKEDMREKKSYSSPFENEAVESKADRLRFKLKADEADPRAAWGAPPSHTHPRAPGPALALCRSGQRRGRDRAEAALQNLGTLQQ